MVRVLRLSLVQPPPARAAGARDSSVAEDEFAGRDDDELMLLAREGSLAAFDVIVRRHQQRLSRMALHRLRDPAIAADVVQDTFLQAYLSLPKYQARGKLICFLCRVLINRCRMVRRSALRRQIGAETDPDITGTLDPDRVLEREQSRQIDAALARLSDKLRDVVLLRHCAELSYDEIAESLNIPVGTAKRRHFDAMQRLRSLLEEEAC
jgi:RNA polymerase sigma-70 factor (ECF subfamily)